MLFFFSRKKYFGYLFPRIYKSSSLLNFLIISKIFNKSYSSTKRSDYHSSSFSIASQQRRRSTLKSTLSKPSHTSNTIFIYHNNFEKVFSAIKQWLLKSAKP